MTEEFEIVGPLEDTEVIGRGHGLRARSSLIKRHGKGNRRKLKAVAPVRLAGGRVRRAGVHWYEAHGVGKVRWKIKTFID